MRKPTPRISRLVLELALIACAEGSGIIYTNDFNFSDDRGLNTRMFAGIYTLRNDSTDILANMAFRGFFVRSVN